MFKKLKDKYKNYVGRYKIYRKLRERYPHYKKFLELEKEMGDWDKARNYLIELEERGYVHKRDDEGVGDTDDLYYKLTPPGKDRLAHELSLWKKVKKNIIMNTILPILIMVVGLVIAAYLINKLLK